LGWRSAWFLDGRDAPAAESHVERDVETGSAACYEAQFIQESLIRGAQEVQRLI
jgi:hypothetical protein